MLLYCMVMGGHDDSSTFHRFNDIDQSLDMVSSFCHIHLRIILYKSNTCMLLCYIERSFFPIFYSGWNFCSVEIFQRGIWKWLLIDFIEGHKAIFVSLCTNSISSMWSIKYRRTEWKWIEYEFCKKPWPILILYIHTDLITITITIMD